MRRVVPHAHHMRNTKICLSDAIAFDLDAGIHAVPGVCSHTVALQEMFLNLLGWCFGKLINDSDVARQHEVRHAWFKELEKFFVIDMAPVDGRNDDHHVPEATRYH